MAATNGQQKRYFRLSGGAGTRTETNPDDEIDGDLANEGQYQRLRQSDVMTVCIRGVDYKIDKKILRSTPYSTLYKMSQQDGEGAFYVNRNPAIFQCVLDYYVTGQLHLPAGMCGQQVRRDVAFWGLDTDVIAPCCAAKLRDG